jgi:hypothetical protein
MPQPTVTDVHVNVPLTNISIAYIQQQQAYRAAEIFPMIPVQKMSDKYFYYTKSYWFTNEAKIRADGAESEGTGYGIDSSNSYSCDIYALHHDLGDRVVLNADSPLNMQRDSTLFLTQKLLLAREKKWVDNFFTTGKWGGSTALVDPAGCTSAALTANYGTPASAICYWNDYTNSTPIQDIRHYKMAMAAQTGFVPNTLVLGPKVFETLCMHPDVIERIKYGGTPGAPAVMSEQALAQVLGVDRVVVPLAVMNSGAEGIAAATAEADTDFLYGLNALLCYSNPSPSLLTPSAGYTFGWTGYLMGGGGYQNAGGAGWFAVRDFRIEWRRALRIEAEMAMDMKLIAADLGIFMHGVTSA